MNSKTRHSASHSKLRGFVVNITRALFVVGPFIWIFKKIDFQKLLVATHEVMWWTIPAVVLVVNLAIFLQGFRWWILMRGNIPDLSLKRVMAAHYKGVFYSMILPTSAAQDVVRSVVLSNSTNYSSVWGATWICRLLGLLALGFLSLCGFILIDNVTVPFWMMQAVILTTLVMVILIFFSFSKAITKHARPMASRILPQRVFAAIDQIRQSIFQYKEHRLRLLAVLGLTFVVQCLAVSITIVAVWGIQGQPRVAECILFVPMIEVISISLPLTPNGIGIRDGLSSLFLSTYLGFSPEQIGIFVIIIFLGVICRVVGAVVPLWELLMHHRSTFSVR